MEAFRALSRINSMRIVKELNEFLEAEAKRLGMSKHGLILKILWEYKGGVKNGRH